MAILKVCVPLLEEMYHWGIGFKASQAEDKLSSSFSVPIVTDPYLELLAQQH